jgi:hypothetical protein
MELTYPSIGAEELAEIKNNLYLRSKNDTSVQFNDQESKKLYAPNITDKEIRKLVLLGANVNYTAEDKKPVPPYYALSTTAQGLKNMETILELGAHLNAAWWPSGDSCLQAAANVNNTDMILLIISREKKEIFINNTRGLFAIDAAFYYKNLAVVKALVERELITPNHGVERYAHWKKPSQEILQYLISKGATNLSGQLQEQVGVCITFTDWQRDMIQSFCKANVYTKEGLEYLEQNKKTLEFVINLIKSNKPNETKNIDNK